MAYRSSVESARDGFWQLVRAEWTKFRSVRSTVFCLLIAAGLTVVLSLLVASVGGTNANESPRYVDEFTFVHVPMTGDGEVIAHVASQENSHEWAKAGIIVKDGVRGGAPYAAMLVTPAHGTRMEANFSTGTAADPAGAPRWLKLSRSGTTVTGATSADGTQWNNVGTANLPSSAQAEVGLFVTSPPREEIVKQAAGSQGRSTPTTGVATFDHVSVLGATPQRWAQDVIADDGSATRSDAPAVAGGSVTVRGSGDMSGYGLPNFSSPGDDDTVVNSLVGVQIGLMAVIALGVIFAVAEFKTGLVRVTFAASPRRGRVLLAKAVVLATSVFVVGLVAAIATFLLTQPRLRANGFSPPAYPYLHLSDPPVLRAVIGTALFLAVLAIFSLAIGTIMRRSARAIVLTVALILVPQILSAAVPSIDGGKWISRISPVAGLAIQQTRERFDTAIGPWAGFGVFCAYGTAALVAALWLLRRRDA